MRPIVTDLAWSVYLSARQNREPYKNKPITCRLECTGIRVGMGPTTRENGVIWGP